jgi:enoyl-CoA hydratase/carnithine racemase
MTTVVEIESRDRIGILRFNRLGALNVTSVELAQASAGGLIALDHDEAVDGIVLPG